MAKNSKYAEMGKDALTAEIKTRRAAGRKLSVDLRGDEDTLRAALDADDVDNGEFPSKEEEPLAGSGPLGPKDEAKPKHKLPPVSPREVGAAGASLHDQVAATAEAPATEPTQPTEEEWAGGGVYKHKGDGFRYQVVKRATDAFNKPFKARVPAQTSGHPGFFWEGSEAEFADTFTKE